MSPAFAAAVACAPHSHPELPKLLPKLDAAITADSVSPLFQELYDLKIRTLREDLGGTYGVSKHGVLSLTETLYNDLRARNAKIGASVLCPGLVNTRIYDAERNRHAGYFCSPYSMPCGMTMPTCWRCWPRT